jgi:hypothetical protein
MKFIDIMTTIFEYENFATILTATTLGIFLLFILVLVAGLRDTKKKNEKPIELVKEELEEVTMEELKEELIIKEEVTLEMPSITKNLEEFKKAIEEEIKYEDEDTKMDVQINKNSLENTKSMNILNINEIENTVITEPKKKEETKQVELIETEEKEEKQVIEEPISIKEESIIEVQKINIPLLKPDEDEELLFRTMTALRLPQDI